jgi:hypothetical protein
VFQASKPSQLSQSTPQAMPWAGFGQCEASDITTKLQVIDFIHYFFKMTG